MFLRPLPLRTFAASLRVHSVLKPCNAFRAQFFISCQNGTWP